MTRIRTQINTNRRRKRSGCANKRSWRRNNGGMRKHEPGSWAGRIPRPEHRLQERLRLLKRMVDRTDGPEDGGEEVVATGVRTDMIRTRAVAASSRNQESRTALGSFSTPVTLPSLALPCKEETTTGHRDKHTQQETKIRLYEHPEDQTAVEEEGLVSPNVAARRIESSPSFHLVFIQRLTSLLYMPQVGYHPPPILPASCTTLSVSVVLSLPTSLITSR